MVVKMSLAPRFKIEMIKELKGKGYHLRVGDIYDGLSLHNKPVDGLRWYFGKKDYALIPLDHFKIIARY
jgi:hypothetical protein